MFGIDVELIRSSGGVFEVFVEDQKIYSKKQTGEFPEDDQMIAEIEKLRK